MTPEVLQSTALVNFVQGEHITDVQILINDYTLFCKLPGKFERMGVKSLASWPIFITAIYNEAAIERSPFATAFLAAFPAATPRR